MKITAIKQQVKRAGRYSIFIDGQYTCSLSEAALVASGLAPGQELTGQQVADLKKSAGIDKAFNNALRFAAARLHSEWEFSQYFRRKAIDEETVALIMPRLANLGFVNDEAFARAWVLGRRQLKNSSRRKLSAELKQKQVSPSIIQRVISEEVADDLAALNELIAKKRRRYPDRQKLMQYLARQGFSYDDIKSALNETNDD